MQNDVDLLFLHVRFGQQVWYPDCNEATITSTIVTMTSRMNEDSVPNMRSRWVAPYTYDGIKLPSLRSYSSSGTSLHASIPSILTWSWPVSAVCFVCPVDDGSSGCSPIFFSLSMLVSASDSTRGFSAPPSLFLSTTLLGSGGAVLVLGLWLGLWGVRLSSNDVDLSLWPTPTSEAPSTTIAEIEDKLTTTNSWGLKITYRPRSFSPLASLSAWLRRSGCAWVDSCAKSSSGWLRCLACALYFLAQLPAWWEGSYFYYAFL